MAPVEGRVKKEQLRKRLKNLLRRHNDFWRLYSIKSWVVMEMPNGRIYTYYSHPDVAVPTKQEIVRVCLFFGVLNVWVSNLYRPNVLSLRSTNLHPTMTPVTRPMTLYQSCQRSLFWGVAMSCGGLCRTT
jgi:hypothetical protein